MHLHFAIMDKSEQRPTEGSISMSIDAGFIKASGIPTSKNVGEHIELYQRWPTERPPELIDQSMSDKDQDPTSHILSREGRPE